MQKWQIESKLNYSLLNCTPLFFVVKLFNFFTCYTLKSKRLKKFLIHIGFSICEVLRVFVRGIKNLVCSAQTKRLSFKVAPLS